MFLLGTGLGLPGAGGPGDLPDYGTLGGERRWTRGRALPPPDAYPLREARGITKVGFATALSWLTVTDAVEEIVSGVTDHRPKRQALLKAAKQRQLDGILGWKLDRWGRSPR